MDQLGWAARPEAVARFTARAHTPKAVFAASWRDGWADRAERAAGAPVYAVALTVHQDLRHVSLREAVVWTNTTDEPATELAFRVITPGGDWRAWVDGRPVAARPGHDGIWIVPLHAPVLPGALARVLLRGDHQPIPPFADVDDYVPRLDVLGTGAFGRADGVLNLGFLLPLLTGRMPDGQQDRRPLPAHGEHSWFDPAHVHLTLDVPSQLVVATTGVEIARRTSDARTTLRVVAAGVREMGIEASAHFAIREREVDGVRLRAFHRPWEPDVGRDLLDHAESALHLFESLWGPLPYRELDLVDAPIRVAAGMEFPQLVTIDMADGDRYATTSELRWTIAHEVAHQWWYAEVGSDPREEPWLDEALAAQGAALHLRALRGDPAVTQRWARDAVEPHRVLAEEGRLLSAGLPADRYALDQYATLVYGKAPLFLEAVRRALGDARYHAALRRYRDTHRLRSATGEDLIRALEAAAEDPATIRALHRRWIVEVVPYRELLPDGP